MQELPRGLRIAVVRGGPSHEHDVSRKTGKAILESLSTHHQALDVFIDRDGTWHLYGIPKQPADVLAHVDVVVNALHGHYGEDGQFQRLLDQYNVRHTGSKSFPSALAFDKVKTKKIFAEHGIATPLYKTYTWLPEYGDEALAGIARELFTTFPIPAIIKPIASGSSLGITLYRSGAEILPALIEAFTHSSTVIVEEFIEGKEVTVAVLENFRDHKHYAAPAVEIERPAGIYHFSHKYENPQTVYCPARVRQSERDQLLEAAKQAHCALGLSHCSRTDFIIHPRRGVYALEINSAPALTPEATFTHAFAAVGVTFDQILAHLVHLALLRK